MCFYLGKDVLAKAKTGTGKTVAFLVRHFLNPTVVLLLKNLCKLVYWEAFNRTFFSQAEGLISSC